MEILPKRRPWPYPGSVVQALNPRTGKSLGNLDGLYRDYQTIWLRDGTIGDEQWAIPWFESAIGFTVSTADFTQACGKVKT